MIEDVLKQALEAMNAMLTHMGMDEDEWNKVTFNQMRKAITSIRQAIADLEKQEPVAWIDAYGTLFYTKEAAYKSGYFSPIRALYAHPQPRKPLTNDGYHCVICGRFLLADEYGVILHDDIEHPPEMTFDDEEKPQ